MHTGRVRSTDIRGVDELAKKDGHVEGDGEPLFIRVENALRRQAAGSNGWKATEPPKEPISVSPPQEGELLAVEEDEFFTPNQVVQHTDSKGTPEKGSYDIKTHGNGIISAKVRGDEDPRLLYPSPALGMWVSSVSKKFDSGCSKTAHQMDLAFTHRSRFRDKAVGDFTSIAFGLEDLHDAEEDLQLHRSTASLPGTRLIDLETQLMRPFTSPASNGSPLFMTSQSLDGHLTPRGEKLISVNDSTDLSHNLESWMSLLPEALQHLPLNYLYIPGEIYARLFRRHISIGEHNRAVRQRFLTFYLNLSLDIFYLSIFKPFS